MVFQSYALFPHMSARRNVGFGLAMQRVPRRDAEKRIDEGAGAGAGLSGPRADKLPGQMSGRPAAARRHRARHRDPPARGADGRTAVQPRRQAPAGDARRDPPHPRGHRLDHHLRHPRPGRGPVDGRPHRGDARRPHPPDRHAPRSSTSAPPTPTWPSSWATARKLAGRVVSAGNGRATVEACGSRLEVSVRAPVAPGDP